MEDRMQMFQRHVQERTSHLEKRTIDREALQLRHENEYGEFPDSRNNAVARADLLLLHASKLIDFTAIDSKLWATLLERHSDERSGVRITGIAKGI